MSISYKDVMNAKKIAFIICTNNSIQMSECRYYIDRLYVPESYEIQVIEIDGAVSMTSGYNFGMRQTNAAYKVYLHQDTLIFNRRMIIELLDIFKDPSVGMIGLIGGDLYEDADIHHYWNKGHVLNATYNELLDVDMRINDTDSDYIPVQAVDGLLIATQYDIEWDERIDKWHMYDIAQSIRFRDAGYGVYVLNNERTWALHDAGFCSEAGYDEARKRLAEIYPEYFKYSELERELIIDDMDTEYLKQIRNKIAELEVSKSGHSDIPEDFTEFVRLYNEVKYLIYRMSFGMPGSDWSRLCNMLLSRKISTSCLMELIARCSLVPDLSAEMLEFSLSTSDTTITFFDQYQRYHTAYNIITGLKTNYEISKAEILEVGSNAHKNLGKELRHDEITYTDISIPSEYRYDNHYIKANACKMPEITDNSYDFCVALDVFEHIAPMDRPKFVSELFRVCRYAVIMSFPYKSDQVEAAERNVNNFCLKCTGKDNPWLIEHIDNGLPDRSVLDEYLKGRNICYFSFTHGSIDIWEKMTIINTLIDNEELNQDISDLNFYYNREIYSSDSSEADYRAFYVLYKDASSVNLPMFFNKIPNEVSFADALYKLVIGTYDDASAT